MLKYLDVEPGAVNIMGMMNDWGKFVQLLIDVDFLRRILESSRKPAEEIQRLQVKEYIKNKLHLNFPALMHEGEPFDRVQYYSDLVVIKGGGSIDGSSGVRKNYLCSQWSERPENNDRSYILK